MAASRSTVVLRCKEWLDSAKPAPLVMEPRLLPKRDAELDREWVLELFCEPASTERARNRGCLSPPSFSFASPAGPEGSVVSHEASSESLICCRSGVPRSAPRDVDAVGESALEGRLGELVLVLGLESRFWGLL